MPSTYTTNNGLEKIGTGEQSGTWGDTTNLNFDILDQALDGLVTITATDTGSSGSPNTLPITDGSLSDGRNRLIIITDGGDLGGSVYYQLTPADAEKIVFLRNSLSGSRDLILFQGSYNAARDLIVPAGKDVIVKFSGTGTSTAVVAPVFADLSLDAATIASADINGGTIDGVTIGVTSVATVINVDNLKLDGNTLSSTDTNGNVVLAPNGDGDVQLDADTVRVGDNNNDVTITTNGTGDLTLNTNGGTNSGSIEIQDGVNTNIIVTANGTGKLELANGDITTSASSGSDAAGQDLTIQAGASTGNAAGGDMIFQTTPAGAGSGTNLNSYTTVLTLTDDSKMQIGTSTAVDSILDEDDMTSDSATALATQQSIKAYVDAQVGTVDTLAEILANGNTTGGTNIQMTTTDELQFRDTGLKISSSADGQLDIDSDGTIDINATTSIAFDTDTLYVDSANDRVGVNATPSYPFHVQGSNGASGSNANVAANEFFLDNDGNTGMTIGTSNTGTGYYAFADSDVALRGGMFYDHTDDYLGFRSGSATGLVIDSSQRVLIGHTSALTSSLTPRLQVVGTDASSSAVNTFRFGDTAFPPYYQLTKSRSTSAGSFAIVQDDDSLGQIRWMVDDGTNYSSVGASIESNVDGTPGANDTPARLVFSTTADGSSSPTERMRISQNGDVDIGQTGGGVKLAVAGAVGPQNGTAAAPTHTFYSDTDTGMYRAAANNIGWSTGGKEGMRLNGSQELIVSDGFSTITGGVSRLTVGGGSTDTQGVSIGRFTSNASSTWLNFFKSNSDTWNTHALVSANTSIADIAAYASDGASYLEAASIEMDVDGTPGANDMPGVIKFNTTADGASSPTERMRINNAGHVKIGDGADPSYLLHVGGSTGGAHFAYDKDNNDLWLASEYNASSQTDVQFTMKTRSGGNWRYGGIWKDGDRLRLVGGGTNSNITANTTALTIDESEQLIAGARDSVDIGSTSSAQIQAYNSSVQLAIARFNASGSPALFMMGSAKTTTIGDADALADGDGVGEIRFSAADGTDIQSQAATIAVDIDGTVGSNDTPGRLVFSTTADGASSATERMRIDNAGLVTIGDGGGAITPLRIKKAVSDTIDLDKTYNVAPKGAWLELYNPGGTTGGGVGISALGLGTEGRYAAIAMTDQTSDNSGTGGDIQFWTSASKTGALVEAMRIDPDGFVGIGTTDPLSGLHISDGTNAGSPQNASRAATLMIDAGATASADIQLMVRNGYNQHIFFGDAANANVGMINYDHSTNEMNFTAGATSVASFDSDGLKMVAGKGIKFDAYGSNNILDDYEEGTWTPVYTAGGGGSIAASTVTKGYYVKVGKMVQISFQIASASVSSPSGEIQITGLPFTSSSQSDNRAGFGIGFVMRFATDIPNFYLGILDNVSYIRMHKNATTASGSSLLQGSDLGTGSNNNYIYASGTYQTT